MTRDDAQTDSNAPRGGLAGLRADVAELAAARIDLARLELAASVQAGKRWALAASGFAIVATAGTTLLLALGGEKLADRYGGSALAWKGTIALGCLLLGIGGLLFLARHIRRTFRPMANTVDELREDTLWLREWLREDDSAQ